MRKKHKLQHLTKNDINEVKRIQQTTTCNYNKRGNVNDMSPYRNITVAKYNNFAAVLHYRVDKGTHHYNVNKVKELEKKYGTNAVIKMFGNEIKQYL